jgi:hypothetical protein
MSRSASASGHKSGDTTPDVGSLFEVCMESAALDGLSTTVDVYQANTDRAFNNKNIDSSPGAGFMSASLKRESDGTP